ncbi:MAG: response regulator transcription factor [Acidobacteriota bacterium]|nr:response regulator transcription factor [Acidobacteriota bacterium]MDQ2844528.1 response regulator transcription factor [Acidobacteriota bacterium]
MRSVENGYDAGYRSAWVLMPPIRILLANHQPIIRSGLRLLLEREPDFHVVAEAADGREAIVLADFKHPDIALLEVKLPYANGIAVAREISSKRTSPKPVFVTAHTDEGYVIEAFKAGATGYVAGDSAPTDLSHAIRVVANGRLFLSPVICMQLLASHLDIREISDYERQLYCLIAAGYGDREIAKRLNAELSKIRTDCQSINTASCSPLPEVIAKSIFANHCALEEA